MRNYEPETETVWTPRAGAKPHTCDYRDRYATTTAVGTIGLCNLCGKFWKVRHEYPFFDCHKWVKVRWYHFISHGRIERGG